MGSHLTLAIILLATVDPAPEFKTLTGLCHKSSCNEVASWPQCFSKGVSCNVLAASMRGVCIRPNSPDAVLL